MLVFKRDIRDSWTQSIDETIQIQIHMLRGRAIVPEYVIISPLMLESLEVELVESLRPDCGKILFYRGLTVLVDSNLGDLEVKVK